MRVGIFGRTGSGKSTLFRALAGGEGATGPGRAAGVCTVGIPDERVDRLSALFKPKKTTHIAVTFVEIDPGETELLPPETLAKIRSVEVLTLVLRGFADDFHPLPPGGLDPVREFRSLESELVLSDYLVAQKRIERMTKEARRDAEWTALHKAVDALEKEVPLRRVDLAAEEYRVLSGFRFASRIPLLIALNVGEKEVDGEAYPELSRAAKERKIPLVRLSARVEEEIAQLSPSEQADFLREMGIVRSARDRLIRGAFDAMDDICFFTVGDEEVRAWNVRRGTTAVAAAGKVHSDLERGFIRAEVLGWEDLLRFGSFAKAKGEGRLRVEGKDYIVREGDVLHIRFHV